ncbi:MAG: 3'-5' exonuclease [Bacteroidales bacterium]
MNQKNTIFDCINVMVDIETTSTENNAGILSIALVPFDPQNGEFLKKAGEGAANDHLPGELAPRSFYPSLTDQFFHGAHFDSETQDWWKNKPDSVKNEIINDQRFSFYNSMQSVESFIQILRDKYVHHGDAPRILFWSQGIDFDRRILENAFERNGIEIPWKYYDWMDCRTVTTLFGIEHDRSKIVHSAYADCVNQINELIQATSHLAEK